MKSGARFLSALVVLSSLGVGAPSVRGTEPDVANPLNEPLGEPGFRPLGADGQPLNLDFETGTLRDWTAAGNAFEGQPVEGEIDQNRTFGEGKRAEHTGKFWLGGYERSQDGPTGSLVSAPFEVTHPFASFLIGGGSGPRTRVELALVESGETFFTAHGQDQENLRPVLVPLDAYRGKKIVVRIVDESSDGWGHVNFDDFRLHAKRPRFRSPLANDAFVPAAEKLYPHAGLSAEDAAEAMELPEGFSVQVGAAEPDVRQPIAMALDDRGRVWIAEAYEYPRRATDGAGKDRVLIFEDTDLDGSLDKRTVFHEGLNLVSGLEVGFGGVFVGAAPHLLYIPDRDGDDRPDGEPEILLDGWGYEDTHETLNAFIWGPDGWLYGCHGVFTHSRVGPPGTPDEERHPINAGIWRYHPTERRFEVFAHGTSNPWGLDFDRHGEAFATACVIPHLFHIIPGGRYERQAGEHFNRFTYDDLKTIALHRHYVGNQWNDENRRQSDESGGGHAHAGAMLYQGGAWPAEYSRGIFMNNIHGNRWNHDSLVASGSGFVGDRLPDFLLTRDQWSQMLYMTYGPDGQVWVIDWYDSQQCHDREPTKHDRGNGRIYRVAYRDARPVAVDLQKASDEELIRRLTDANEWYSRHARRILQERAARGALAPTTRDRIAAGFAATDDVAGALRWMWALRVTGSLGTAEIERSLASPFPQVRAWAIRLLFDSADQEGSPAAALALAQGASDTSPIVRLALASALQRIPGEDRWDSLEKLGRFGEDAADHNLPLMVWYALEPLADLDARRALAVSLSMGERIPLLRDFMIRRLGSDPEASLALLVEGLSDANGEPLQLTFLRGLRETLRGRRSIATPDGWSDVYSKLARSANTEIRELATSLAATFGQDSAIQALLSVIDDDQAPNSSRAMAIETLTHLRHDSVASRLRRLLSHADLGGLALRSLAEFDSPETPAAILEVLNDLPPASRRDALATLCGRPSYAKALLTEIGAGRARADQLTADLVASLRNLQDAEIDRLIERHWGSVRETAADKQAVILGYKNRIQAEGATPDVELGRAVFAKICQQCHTLFGAGGKVGPDLSGANRSSLDYLLSNVLDPSAVMAKEYRPTIVETTLGRTITGILRETTADHWTLQTQNERVVVPIEEIEESRLSPLSMMPEDLLRPLGGHEVRSLFAYLGARGQNAMRATPDNLAGFFNGRDLAGWLGDESLWSVEGGEIVGRSPGLDHNEFLFNEWSVGNFRLSVEIKLVGNQGNSGIQFRSRRVERGEAQGYQADVGPGWWGKLYEENGRGLLSSESGERHTRPVAWNRYEIVAVGSRLRTWINGQLCVDLDDPRGAKRGAVAFQLHSGGPTEVRIRDLQLTLLEPPAADASFARSTPLVEPKKSIKFERFELDKKFRSEGVTHGDFDNDGLWDLAAGSVWYHAPDWKMNAIAREPREFDIHTYGDTFCNWSEDLDGDGRTDLIVVDFPGKPTWWFRNPGSEGGEWERRMIVPVTNDESPAYVELDRGGRRELVFADAAGRMNLASSAIEPAGRWPTRVIAAPGDPDVQAFYHGLGVGDINRDGRDDVLVPHGWWEAPAWSDATPAESDATPWTFHDANLGEAQANLYVYDFDDDGDADVVGSSAHKRGIWWYGQSSEGWTTHPIDASIAQTHALCLADINGDGLPDLVTGKRYYAHNGRDPGEDEPAELAWFEMSRADGKPAWTKRVIDSDSGVGTQFEVFDMNRDGLLDILVANKRGVFYFQQTRE